MKVADVDKFADTLVKHVKAYVGRTQAPITASIADLEEKLAALERRLAAIEGQPRSAYRGAWAGSERYDVGDQVSFQGSLWTARAAGSGMKPGSGSEWKMQVKRGRAA